MGGIELRTDNTFMSKPTHIANSESKICILPVADDNKRWTVGSVIVLVRYLRENSYLYCREKAGSRNIIGFE